MTEAEMITFIGELIATEFDDANRIEYKNETSLILIMENGKRFVLEIREISRKQNTHN